MNTQVANDRFNDWDSVIFDLQEVSDLNVVQRYAIIGLVAQAGSDMAYLRTLVGQKFVKRHSLTAEEREKFKQQIQFAHKAKTVYTTAKRIQINNG